MSTALNKRQQARNERALQSLLRDVPGNNVCADCDAREPGWASYNLGIFLCVRCASCHRALGTHISRVKSISMDVWTSEQIASIKQTGNIASNRIYNPRNVRARLPLDPDLIDKAMERYIKDKYQHRTMAAGSQAMRHDTGSTTSTDDHPPPPPPKPISMFAPNLRSVSATFPLSRREQPLPQLPSQFNTAASPAKSPVNGSRGRRGSLTSKLNELRDMGFQDERRNAAVLKGLNGNLEKTVESLIRLGEGRPRYEQQQNAPQQPQQMPSRSVSYDQPESRPHQPHTQSYSTGLPLSNLNPSYNPYQNTMQQQSAQPTLQIEQQMQAINLSQAQPNTQHSSNWYDAEPAVQHPSTLTPPISPRPYQHPSTQANFQRTSPLPQQVYQGSPAKDSNPFLRLNRTNTMPVGDIFAGRQPSPAPSTLSYNHTGQQGYNLPDPFTGQQSITQLPQQQLYQQPAQQYAPSIAAYYPQAQNPFPMAGAASPEPIDPWAPTFAPAQAYNPFPNESFQQQQQSPARMDKTDILALFGPPGQYANQSPTSPTSQEPSDGISYAVPHQAPTTQQPQRSVTMPASLSNLSSNPGRPNNNPFASMTSTAPSATPGTMSIGHVRKESKEFAGSPTNGRHSPDAFASLSARYG